jgi:protein-arginine kinase activator protein McsA
VTCYHCDRPSTKLCDGKLPDKTTCDRALCPACAYNQTSGLLRLRSKGRNQTQIISIDYCQDCRATGGRIPTLEE